MDIKIFLVGIMGSGKSYWAGKLAKHYQVPALDLDRLVEKQANQSIATIFGQKGEAAFREMEADLLRNALPESGFVLATGGGVPCFHNNMEFMKQSGIVIWLDPPESELLKRLNHERSHRPLLANTDNNPEKLLEKLRTLMQQRQPFYQQAHLRVENEKPAIDDFVDKIAELLNIKK